MKSCSMPLVLKSLIYRGRKKKWLVTEKKNKCLLTWEICRTHARLNSTKPLVVNRNGCKSDRKLRIKEEKLNVFTPKLYWIYACFKQQAIAWRSNERKTSSNNKWPWPLPPKRNWSNTRRRKIKHFIHTNGREEKKEVRREDYVNCEIEIRKRKLAVEVIKSLKELNFGQIEGEVLKSRTR